MAEINFIPVKPSTLGAALIAAHKAGINVMIHGAAGIGKTDIVYQAGAEIGGSVHDLYLATAEPTDIRGFPMPNRESGSMDWLPPNTLPREGRGIIFGDEFGTAMPAVQAAMLTLMHGRRTGAYTVPEDFSFVLATNRAQDRNVSYKLLGPMANRLTHLFLEPNLDDWTTWAVKSGVSTPVIGFIRFRPELLHRFDSTSTEPAYPTPRSWVAVSKMLEAGVPAELMHLMVTGTVGHGPGTEFMGFLKIYRSLPSIDGILLNPDTADVPSDPATLYALSGALARKVTTATFGRALRYLKRLPKEFEIFTMKDAMRLKSALQSTREFIGWASENAEIIF